MHTRCNWLEFVQLSLFVVTYQKLYLRLQDRFQDCFVPWNVFKYIKIWRQCHLVHFVHCSLVQCLTLLTFRMYHLSHCNTMVGYSTASLSVPHHLITQCDTMFTVAFHSMCKVCFKNLLMFTKLDHFRTILF